jgi:hypothetical protein
MEPRSNYIDFRRRSGVADTINATFYFFRNELRGLLKSLAFIVGPMAVLAAVLMAGDVGEIYGSMFTAEYWLSEEIQGGAAYWAGMLVAFVGQLLAIGVFYAYAIMYVEQGQGDFTPGEVWRRMRSDAGRFITTILWGIAVYAGLILVVIIPILGIFLFFGLMIYLAPIFWLILPARLDRREGFWRAFRRSRGLVKGSWWSSFGLLFVTLIVVMMMGTGVTVAATFLYTLVSQLMGDGLLMMAASAVLSTISAIWYIFYALPVVAFVVWYFSLVEEEEAISLEARIEAMAAPASSERIGA